MFKKPICLTGFQDKRRLKIKSMTNDRIEQRTCPYIECVENKQKKNVLALTPHVVCREANVLYGCAVCG